MTERAIGLIDSGVGGLTILDKLMKDLPQENYLYLGDNYRAPYGNRSDEEIDDFTDDLVDFLLDREIKMLILACNTVTAISLDRLKASLPIPVLGVIRPAAKHAVNLSRNQRIGVIGTQATIRNGAYERMIRQYNPQAQIFSKATQSFVDLVENNQQDQPFAREIIAKELEDLKAADIDSLILACTHFPFLEDQISDFFQGQIQQVHAGQVLPDIVRDLLIDHDLLNQDTDQKPAQIYTTGDIEDFQKLADRRLEKGRYTIEKIDLKG